MIIDWYTVIFQIINFLILVFLLRRFLYGPIIKAMDEREQKILQREKDAAAKKQEAEENSRAYIEKKEELEEKKEEIKEEVRAEAGKDKQEMLKEARREVGEARRRWEEDFEREKESFINELRRRIGLQACSVARSCLEDLADSRLEELIWEVFLSKIKELSARERSSLQDALAEDNNKVTLKAAFDPPEEKIKELKKVIRDQISASNTEPDLSVKKDRGLICGLELDSGGHRAAWSIDNYLEGVEEEILKDMEEKALSVQDGEVKVGGQTKNQK